MGAAVSRVRSSGEAYTAATRSANGAMRSATAVGLRRARRRRGAGRWPGRAGRRRWWASGRGGRAARGCGPAGAGCFDGRGHGADQPTVARGAHDSLAAAGRRGGRRAGRCPRLVRVARAGRRREGRPAFARLGLLGAAGVPGFGDPAAHLLVVGPRARPPTAPTAPAGCSPATGPATSSTPPCTAPATPTSRRRCRPRRRARLTRRVHHGAGAVRAAGQQADPGRARHLPPVPRARAGAAADVRVVLALGQFGWDVVCAVARRAAPAAVRPRRRGAAARRPDAARQLPREPAEHLHRHAHPEPMLDAVLAARARAARPQAADLLVGCIGR